MAQIEISDIDTSKKCPLRNTFWRGYFIRGVWQIIFDPGKAPGGIVCVPNVSIIPLEKSSIKGISQK
jgi:hypothetical protein